MTPPTDVSSPESGAAWYVGIDCGGTFTDHLVMANAQREVHVFKALSVPA